jgi:hypothetical protein
MATIIRRIIFTALVIAATTVIVKAFFMPWLGADTSAIRATKQVVQANAGELKNAPVTGVIMDWLGGIFSVTRQVADVNISMVVTGCEIPRIAATEMTKTSLILLKTLFDDVRGIDEKSKLVYLVPGLAILCSLIAIAGMRFRIAVFILFLVSGTIALGALYKILTTPLSTPVIKLSIKEGLWLTVHAYLFIFSVSMIWLALELWTRKRR